MTSPRLSVPSNETPGDENGTRTDDMDDMDDMNDMDDITPLACLLTDTSG